MMHTGAYTKCGCCLCSWGWVGETEGAGWWLVSRCALCVCRSVYLSPFVPESVCVCVCLYGQGVKMEDTEATCGWSCPEDLIDGKFPTK